MFLGICVGDSLPSFLCDSKCEPTTAYIGRFLQYDLIRSLAFSNSVSSFISLGHSFQSG